MHGFIYIVYESVRGDLIIKEKLIDLFVKFLEISFFHYTYQKR